MSRAHHFFIFLFTIMIAYCHGFHLSMERVNFSLKDQSYCGFLRCQVDTITEDKASSLMKMDIYYLNNRTLLATILSKDPEIQSQTRNTVNVTGSMSDHHGELRLYFTETADCVEAHFICRISFFLASGQTDFAEQTTLSTSRAKDGQDLYVKSQISYEQTISDQSGLILKKLISPNEFLKNRMAFSFKTRNLDTISSEEDKELTKDNIISQDINHPIYIKQCLSDLKSTVVYMVNVSMTEMSNDMVNTFDIQKNLTVFEIQHKEKIAKEYNDNKLLQLDNKLNDMIKKIEVCAASKELIQSDDGQRNTKISFESISNELNELRANQETMKNILANLSSTLSLLKLQKAKRERCAHLSRKVKYLKLQEKGGSLICEGRMDSSLKSREVTSIDGNTNILCDTKTDGGGWIIIQRRVNGETNFNVGWDMYKRGFGSLQGDFWLGNDVISNLTRKNRYMLRIDMRCENVDSFAVYDYFKVEDETQLYTLRLGAFYGNASDKLTFSKDLKFTTLDKDNTKRSVFGCEHYENPIKGWWVKECDSPNLNGVWGGRDTNSFIYWDKHVECSFVEMKLRKVTLGVI